MRNDYDVACLGPVGTYSEDATIAYFGEEATRLLLPSLDEVFYAVEFARSEFGVVAVENTTEGSVPRTMDLLAGSELQICGEMTLAIRHALMSSASSLHAIQCVRAHAQALAQCHSWLSVNVPDAKREAVGSNAEGARMASNDPTSAAIASVRSARQYGLPVLCPDVQDIANNQTRFLILGKQDEHWSENTKTSLIVSIANEPGTLYKALEPFYRHGVSMCRLESRPSKREAWEYNFYIDVLGHRTDGPIAIALEELRKIASVRMLGSYTASASQT